MLKSYRVGGVVVVVVVAYEILVSAQGPLVLGFLGLGLRGLGPGLDNWANGRLGLRVWG